LPRNVGGVSSVIPYAADGDDISDGTDDSLVVMEAEHANIHKGKAYFLYSSITIAGTSSAYIQLKTGSKFTHFKSRNLTNISANNVLYTVYESPTITDGTTAVPSINANRNSTNNSANVFYNNPTSVSGGTQLVQVYLAGSVQFRTSESAIIELIYKPNTNYVAKVDNLNAGNATIYFSFFWYEI